jgi:hypothetical protein
VNGKGYPNDQVFSLNVSASVTRTFKAFALSVHHQSDHSAILFKCSAQVESMVTKRLIVPTNPDKLDEIMDSFNFLLDTTKD